MDLSHDILQSFKIGAIQQYGANSILYTVLITVVFSMLARTLSTDWIYSILNYIKTYYPEFIPQHYRKKVISFEGSLITRITSINFSNQTNFSKNMKYLWKYINTKTNTGIVGKTQFQETFQNCYRSEQNEDIPNVLHFMVKQIEPFQLDPEIWCKIHFEKGEMENKKEDVECNFTIQKSDITVDIYSYTKSLVEIEEYLSKIFARYEMEEAMKKDENLYVYSFKKMSNEDYNNYIEYEESVFKSNKHFHNTFFEQKEALLKKVDFFMNNRDWYAKMGIPYTLGIILHGPPGTGKTSIIKCIGNYMRRHIVNVDLNRISKTSELNMVFFDDKYNQKKIKQSDRILVLEDIDAMDKIVLDRETENDTKSSSDDSDSDCDDVSNIFKKSNSKKSPKKDNLELKKIINEYKKEQDFLTLSQMLNIIDGIHEGDGRVLIMTTNHYHKLDRALVRPGRIDINLEVKQANHVVIQQVVDFLYEGQTLTREQLAKIPEYRWSCAELYSAYFASETLDEFVGKLSDDKIYSKI